MGIAQAACSCAIAPRMPWEATQRPGWGCWRVASSTLAACTGAAVAARASHGTEATTNHNSTAITGRAEAAAANERAAASQAPRAVPRSLTLSCSLSHTHSCALILSVTTNTHHAKKRARLSSSTRLLAINASQHNGMRAQYMRFSCSLVLFSLFSTHVSCTYTERLWLTFEQAIAKSQ